MPEMSLHLNSEESCKLDLNARSVQKRESFNRGYRSSRYRYIDVDKLLMKSDSLPVVDVVRFTMIQAWLGQSGLRYVMSM